MKIIVRIVISAIFLATSGIGILLFFFSISYIIPEITYRRYNSSLTVSESQDSMMVDALKMRELQIALERLKRKLDRLTPSGAFLVINTTENSFKLYEKNRLVLNGLCFTVKNKMEDPVWRKPDWAFIEEGLEIPPPDDPLRFERGVLGDYALNLGHGYLIHGTLYQRLLGMPVTHGCIRLNDEDLSRIYHSLEVGSKVFIY